MKKVNLHVYPSSFKHESRILKETKSIAIADFFEKIIIGTIWDVDLKENEVLDNKREVWRVKLKTRNLWGGIFAKLVKYLEWTLVIFIKFRKEKVFMVNCHSLSSLPVGILFKIFKKSKLIYDTHELETETSMSEIRKKTSKIIEKLLISYVDTLITVSDSIAEWYKKAYGLKEVFVIKNVPYPIVKKKESNILKEKFNLRKNDILFIYQGKISEGRGIQLLLDSFSKVEKKQIVFMGFGDMVDLVMEFEKKSSNIHYHPSVKPQEVIDYTSSADIGISLIEDLCLSYYYSLPNKVFEYLSSDLPILVSDFPEMGSIIDLYDCGWKVPLEINALVNALNCITEKDVEEKKLKVRACKNHFGWDKEEKKLINIFHNIIGKKG